MSIKIALAGNPNAGKTTLFNALTGSNQYVGNWPGVTVEKKEGKLKGYKDIVITDLPGIYSLSPYTLEEVVARNYLLNEKPDAILNIIDGSNLERNLYLTTQLTELGIPVIMAVNMMDVINKRGDSINFDKLGKALGCEVVAISALKGTGIDEAAKIAVTAAQNKESFKSIHTFAKQVESYLSEIKEQLNCDESQKRFFTIKLFERDDKISTVLKNAPNVEGIIARAEKEMDDDSESIITNERYTYISSIIKGCYKKNSKQKITGSDKIDKIVTNRILALPIFAIIMFIVYYISVTTIGGIATDWANDGVFGDGWHLFGIGTAKYEEAQEDWAEKYNVLENNAIIDGFVSAAAESGIDADDINSVIAPEEDAEELSDEEKDSIINSFLAETSGITADNIDVVTDEGEVEKTISADSQTFKSSLDTMLSAPEEPDTSEYGIWIPGIPTIIEKLIPNNTAEWLHSLIIDGIVAGVGAVLGFVPQILVLFIFLAFLESCGYMARIAFIMDRIFRKFGLSGKSFIPILIGTGCGVPAVMASRTIENERDRRMTIMTTTFIPCSAKLPIIALIAGAMFGGAAWVAPSAYFVGIAAIICSGIILKKTKMFEGDPAPFVMELPAYHMPTIGNILRSMWERGSSFIKKAGTIILLSTILIWFLQGFGVEDGTFGMVENIDNSILANIGSVFALIFTPLGWGNWRAAVAAITGLIAKENVVGTFGILYSGSDAVAENGFQVWANLREAYTPIAAYSFLVFNLLCAPCFAACGAIRREMNNPKWTAFAIGYQCGFAYIVSMCIYQFGSLLTGNGNVIGLIASVVAVIIFLYMLLRPYNESKTLKTLVNS